MDLRNLCQRLDVDSLRAKLFSLPQVRLPKSLNNVRAARCIFCSSSENVSGKAAKASDSAVTSAKTTQLPQAPLINRTPQHISTVSSLMHEQAMDSTIRHIGVYCSAGSFDDDYYASYGTERALPPISPIKIPRKSMTTAQRNGDGSLTQTLQRGYENLSKLQIKHLFARQTTIRRDNIEVDRYVEQYEAERRVEQLTENDVQISSLPLSQLVACEKSGKAATRFTEVRKPPLQMPVHKKDVKMQEGQEQKLDQPVRRATRQNFKLLRKFIKHQPGRISIKSNDTNDELGGLSQTTQTRARMQVVKTMRARLRHLTSRGQQQRWRKSFMSSNAQVIRQRGGAATGAADEAATGATFGSSKGTHFERTRHKLYEKIQQFLKRPDNEKLAAMQLGNKLNTIGHEPSDIDDDEELAVTYHYSDESGKSDDSDQNDSADDAFDQLDVSEKVNQQGKRNLTTANFQKGTRLATLAHLHAYSTTAWSSDSDALAAGSDGTDYPCVLIHQQQTDSYESTLIVAVSTTLTPPPSPAANRHQWVLNEQISDSFKEQQQLQTTQASNSSKFWSGPAFYKSKSIDIFESEGRSAAAFADFDEALRNEPVQRISFDRGEDTDDDSLRVTKIRIETPLIGSSCESFMKQQPLKDDEDNGGKQAKESDPDSYEVDGGERRWSMSLRTLPLRRPPLNTLAPIYNAMPTPLFISKPLLPIATTPVATPASVPVLAGPLSKLPQRTTSMTQPSKPLVKTGSLRLTYKENINPGDVGNVNKLISRFEGRSRLSDHRLYIEELAVCCNYDSDEVVEQEELPPTMANIKRKPIPDIVTTPVTFDINDTSSCQDLAWDLNQSPALSRDQLHLILNPIYNNQRSSTSTMETATFNTNKSLAPHAHSQPQIPRCSRRPMTRDNENFYSFDSDEDNSYYSISPSSSNRYVVDI